MFNTGQMLLVLGAMLLFSIALPSLNNAVLFSESNQIVTQVENSALAVAQGYLSEAAVKIFDEVCLTSPPLIAAQLTPVASIGSDAGETYPNFDDVDDYGDLTLVDTTAFPSITFNISGAVDYVDPDNPETTSAAPTFVKRLRVTVTSSYLVDPASGDSLQIMLERLYSYY
jgi:type II secretory pathway pseudopilin PulG